MISKRNIKNLLLMSISAGEIMLRNGAETYRVEDTVTRICKSRGVEQVQVFVTPTGIFLSVEHKGDMFSYIKRIKSIKIDLHKITLINDFSRKFVEGNMSVKQGNEYLEKLDGFKTYKNIVRYLGCGLAGGFFSLMFGGSEIDFVFSFLTSFLLLILLDKISKYETTSFLTNVIGGIFVTTIAGIACEVFKEAHLDMIIIGSIMPLVPGVSITNAIRDSLSGELLSGIARVTESIIVALGIAFGVGITLKGIILITGGI